MGIRPQNLRTLFQILPQGDRIVMAGVLGAEQKGDGWTVLGLLSNPLHEFSLFPEFFEISSLECLPPVGIMAEPFPQIIAGSNFFEPRMDGRLPIPPLDQEPWKTLLAQDHSLLLFKDNPGA